MVQTVHQSYDIQRVRAILPCTGAVQVVFQHGPSACVREGHPDYDNMLQNARNSLQCGSPVGFLINEAGDLLELNYTHQSAVRHVRQDGNDPSRMMVEFWAYSPICYLTRDHPEFERLLHTLERAAKADEQVVLANHMHMIDGETETWWKIMDIRLAAEQGK